MLHEQRGQGADAVLRQQMFIDDGVGQGDFARAAHERADVTPGEDEHGAKGQQSAEKQGSPERQLGYELAAVPEQRPEHEQDQDHERQAGGVVSQRAKAQQDAGQGKPDALPRAQAAPQKSKQQRDDEQRGSWNDNPAKVVVGVADGQQGGGQESDAAIEQLAPQPEDGGDRGAADEGRTKKQPVQVLSKQAHAPRREHGHELGKLKVTDANPERLADQLAGLTPQHGDVAVNVARDRCQLPGAQSKSYGRQDRQQYPFPPGSLRLRSGRPLAPARGRVRSQEQKWAGQPQRAHGGAFARAGVERQAAQVTEQRQSQAQRRPVESQRQARPRAPIFLLLLPLPFPFRRRRHGKQAHRNHQQTIGDQVDCLCAPGHDEVRPRGSLVEEGLGKQSQRQGAQRPGATIQKG